MDKSVVIKSNKNGLALYLDKDLPFSEIKDKLRNKLKDTGKFFANAKMVLTYEGRDLSDSEALEILNVISEASDIEVIAVIDNSTANNKVYEDELKKLKVELDDNACEIYKDSVKKDESLTFKHSVVILGNIEEDGEVHTDGSIFVLGGLYGSAFAGELGNIKAKVYAEIMNPKNVNIAEHAFKMPKEPKKGFLDKFKKEEVKKTSMLLSIVDDEIVIN